MGRITQVLLTFGKAETSAAVASVVDFALTILLVKAVGIWYALASFFGALVGGLINCCVNYRWVFDKQEQGKPFIALKYLLVWGVSILLNTVGTWFFTELSGLYFIIIKAAVAVAVAVFWNYQMQRTFVFRNLHMHNKEKINEI